MLNKEKLQSCSTSVEEGIKSEYDKEMAVAMRSLLLPQLSASCLLLSFLKKNIADSAQLSDFSFLKHHANRLSQSASLTYAADLSTTNIHG
ncbi:hypothetical protein EB796_008922 [Bugula neritina]|uniref:Uncharacterized protein n=1 Tax=Bugula neritina TaxID=10212 RepID=A0A7J7K2A3_BUGNE|nr:hypothetical protein EB796_008922 [Bugula neritina]